MKAQRIRIRCRGESPRVGGFATLPSWPDVEVFAVLEDGREVCLGNVVGNRIEWVAEAGCEPPRCVVELIAPEIDVEGVGVLTLVEPEPAAGPRLGSGLCYCGARRSPGERCATCGRGDG